jgi:hypothetical protein
MGLKLVFEADLGLIFELVLYLFDFEDAFGVNYFFLAFDETIDQVVFGGYTVLEEIFEVFFILFDVIVRNRHGVAASV